MPNRSNRKPGITDRAVQKPANRMHGTSMWRAWWLMTAFMACFVVFFGFYPQALKYLGVIHYKLFPGNGELWFMDLFAILASNDAVSAGLNPYDPNPLDYLSRSHVYPHWWLLLRNLGLTRQDVPWVGMLLGGSFILAVAARYRPKTTGELLWYLAAFCSPPVLLALERANNDLVIFLLLAPVPFCLLARQEAVRLLAVVLIAAATALKTYPVVGMLVLLLDADKHELRRRWIFTAIICVLIGMDLAHDWTKFGKKVPDMRGLLSFGAGHGFSLVGMSFAKAKVAAVTVGLLAFISFMKLDLLSGWTVSPEDRSKWLAFVLGAVVLTGCFFAGTSFNYRWIFGLFLLPFLWAFIHHPEVSERVRRVGIATAVLLMAMLWFNGVVIALLVHFDLAYRNSSTDRSDFVVAAAQPMMWAFFLCLMIFLAHFVRQNLPRVFSSHGVGKSLRASQTLRGLF